MSHLADVRRLMSDVSKLMSMRDAVARFVHDGDTVVIEGFTHLICFAAGHEIIRQGRTNLTLARLTPDLIYDQMIAAGCARKLVFSWAGNPGVGSLHAFRRAVEGWDGPRLELEEYSHFGMVARFAAGAVRVPLWALRHNLGTRLPSANPCIRTGTLAFTGEPVGTQPALPRPLTPRGADLSRPVRGRPPRSGRFRGDAPGGGEVALGEAARLERGELRRRTGPPPPRPTG